MTDVGSALVPFALVLASSLWVTALGQAGPCYITTTQPATGPACVFFASRVRTQADCQTYESELGRGTHLSTSYAYDDTSQACAIVAPGTCQAFSSVLSLQVCSANDAQAAQQLLTTEPLQQAGKSCPGLAKHVLPAGWGQDIPNQPCCPCMLRRCACSDSWPVPCPIQHSRGMLLQRNSRPD